MVGGKGGLGGGMGAMLLQPAVRATNGKLHILHYTQCILMWI